MSESHNECSLKQRKQRTYQPESSYGFDVGRTKFASDADRRKFTSALSLFPKFNAFINRTPTCWLWTAGVDAHGYGQISNRPYSPIKAHRLAWMFRHGPITPAQHVLHKCDTPRCVNPDHLFLGDQAANMKDAAAKGRLNVPRPRSRTLSEEGMRAILKAFSKGQPPRGTAVALARRFGVSKSYVSVIAKGRRWTPPRRPTPALGASASHPASPVPVPPSAVEGQQQ